MSRKILVTNIPVRTCVDGWVIIPDETTDEGVDAAIADSLKEHGFSPNVPTDIEVTDLEVDRAVVDLWEFEIEKEVAP